MALEIPGVHVQDLLGAVIILCQQRIYKFPCNIICSCVKAQMMPALSSRRFHDVKFCLKTESNPNPKPFSLVQSYQKKVKWHSQLQVIRVTFPRTSPHSFKKYTRIRKFQFNYCSSYLLSHSSWFRLRHKHPQNNSSWKENENLCRSLLSK